MTILATHDLSQAKRLADDIVHIHEGRIIEAAPTHEFFTSPHSETTRRFIKGELDY
jgi:tungstate transport system ATP-binding protein